MVSWISFANIALIVVVAHGYTGPNSRGEVLSEGQILAKIEAIENELQTLKNQVLTLLEAVRTNVYEAKKHLVALGKMDRTIGEKLAKLIEAFEGANEPTVQYSAEILKEIIEDMNINIGDVVLKLNVMVSNIKGHAKWIEDTFPKTRGDVREKFMEYSVDLLQDGLRVNDLSDRLNRATNAVNGIAQKEFVLNLSDPLPFVNDISKIRNILMDVRKFVVGDDSIYLVGDDSTLQNRQINREVLEA